MLYPAELRGRIWQAIVGLYWVVCAGLSVLGCLQLCDGSLPKRRLAGAQNGSPASTKCACSG